MDAFLEAPWFDKLFWLFFFGIIAFVAVIWIRVIVEMFRFHKPRPKGSARGKGGGGFGETTPAALLSYDASSSSDSGSSEQASADSGGGSDFSSGGGESGGGGASGSWS